MSAEELVRHLGTNLLLMYATLGAGVLISVVASIIFVAMEEWKKGRHSPAKKELTNKGENRE